MQALEIIKQETKALANLEYKGITLEEVKKWANEEERYFIHFSKKALYDSHVVVYIKLL